MKIYITASFSAGEDNEELDELCTVIKQSGFEDYCFVRDENNFEDAFEMMSRARERIESCDALLLDYDGPTHGRMIELGIAYSMKKKIIVITKVGTVIKDTVLGTADLVIEYQEIKDILMEMKRFFSSLS